MQPRIASSLVLSLLLLAAGSIPVAADSPADLRPLFPDAAQIDERMEADDYQEYGRDRLYDYINGGAEVYLDLDFVKVGARDYIIELQEETYFTLDVYDMSEPDNAAAIYGKEYHGDGSRIDLGGGGHLGGGALGFHAGRYYVKIRADDDSDAVNAILRKMAGIVASRIAK